MSHAQFPWTNLLLSLNMDIIINQASRSHTVLSAEMLAYPEAGCKPMFLSQPILQQDYIPSSENQHTAKSFVCFSSDSSINSQQEHQGQTIQFIIISIERVLKKIDMKLAHFYH